MYITVKVAVKKNHQELRLHSGALDGRSCLGQEDYSLSSSVTHGF